MFRVFPNYPHPPPILQVGYGGKKVFPISKREAVGNAPQVSAGFRIGGIDKL